MKTAVVTGASNGIGRATLLALRLAGFRTFGLDVQSPDTPDPEYFVVDVTDVTSVLTTIEAIMRRTKAIDVLVNNAGMMVRGALADMPIEDFDRQFAVNVRGTFLATQKALPHIPNGGRIVNVASELAYLGRADASAYCGTKARSCR